MFSWETSNWRSCLSSGRAWSAQNPLMDSDDRVNSKVPATYPKVFHGEDSDPSLILASSAPFLDDTLPLLCLLASSLWWTCGFLPCIFQVWINTDFRNLPIIFNTVSPPSSLLCFIFSSEHLTSTTAHTLTLCYVSVCLLVLTFMQMYHRESSLIFLLLC